MIKPIITEKSLRFAQKGWYTFATTRLARKETISKRIEEMFTVNVTTIRSMVMHGKVRRVGRTMRTIQHEDWKKVLVQLKKGQKIDVFDVVPEQTAPVEKK